MSTLDDIAKRHREVEQHWSDEHFADPDAEIPDCEYRMPDCPICSRETENEAGEEIYCEVCKVRWHIDGTHGVREVDE